MAAEFLAQLPSVPVESLPAGSDCPICSDAYPAEPTESGIARLARLLLGKSHEATKAIDSPVRLPCNHIIGGECIRTWISSGGTTCPLCRHRLFSLARNETHRPHLDNGHEAHFPTASPGEASRLLTLAIQAALEGRERPQDIRPRQVRERALYLRLQREGARLLPLPEGIQGISASGDSSREISMNESLAPQRFDRNEEALFEQLQRMGAFNEPIGSRRRLNDDRRLMNRLQWYYHRSHGLVYFPDDNVVNGVRGGEWS